MYLPLDEGFLEHPKTLRFCREIRDPNGSVYLLRLWIWATRSAPDGELAELEPEDLEDTLRWRGEPGACYRALICTGFIDENDDGSRCIHNWMEDRRAGAAIVHMDTRSEEKREAARKRKQEQRERERREREQGGGGHTNVTRDQSVTSAPVTPPVQSRPVQTRQVQREGDPPPRETESTKPAGAEPTSGYDLTRLFALRRSKALPNTIDWDTPAGQSLLKADDFIARHGKNLKAMAMIEPTLDLFFAKARRTKGEEGEKLRKSTFGFATWLSDFGALCQEIAHPRSQSADQGQPLECSFHRDTRNASKKARKEDWRAGCPECRHVDSRGSPRPPGEASSVGDLIQGR